MKKEGVELFLTQNGFEEVNYFTYKNKKCCVYIGEDDYIVKNLIDEWEMFSTDRQIYWLIGVLTYYNLMDRNYKDIKD